MRSGAAGWKLPTDRRSVLLGAVIGLTGAGGQMLLFHAVHTGPTYLIFPLIALSPVVTIALSLLWLQERTTLHRRARDPDCARRPAAIRLPAGSGPERPRRRLVLYSLIILAAWGVQAFFIKLANRSMSAEGIFFYMTLMGLALVPVALWMTDFSQPDQLRPQRSLPRRRHPDPQLRGRADAGLCLPLR